jgi:uncharacterized protein (UPF0303 family)
MAGLDLDLIARLEQQERELVLTGFDQRSAYVLGSAIAGRALDAGLAVLVDIRRPNLVLYRAALPGSTSDQELWAGRKAATTLRMGASSALVAARMSADEIGPGAIGWLGPDYAITGGSFPIRVTGVGVVAAVTASGLTSEEDHDLVVEALRAMVG